MDELNESPILTFLKNNILIVFVSLLGLGCIALGMVQLFGQDHTTDLVIQSESNSVDVKGASDKESSVYVDIEGAVRKPGVYELSAEKRLKDVVEVAGGFAHDVNMSYVAKSLNMASKLQDGMKIYIPFHDESGNDMKQSFLEPGGAGVSAGGLININTASESELDTLPGIGPATAAKIVSSRPFLTVDDILSKKAVGSSVFSKIKDKITVQ